MNMIFLVGLVIGGIYLISKRTEKKLSPCSPMGDVNGDGYIDSEDVLLIENHLAGNITLSSEEMSRAQVRGRTLSIIDALVINNYIIGSIDTFPVCSMEVI